MPGLPPLLWRCPGLSAAQTAPRGESPLLPDRLCAADLAVCDAPTRIRTWGLLLRRESLYPAELSGPDRPAIFRAGRALERVVAPVRPGGSSCFLTCGPASVK